MDGDKSYSHVAKEFLPWVTIGSAAVAVCSFFILLGMFVGPQKDMPAQLEKLLLRVDSVDGRLSKIEWANESQKTQLNLLGNQMAVESSERNKVATALSELKSVVDTIKASYLQRETFIEYKASNDARLNSFQPPTRSK